MCKERIYRFDPKLASMEPLYVMTCSHLIIFTIEQWKHCRVWDFHTTYEREEECSKLHPIHVIVEPEADAYSRWISRDCSGLFLPDEASESKSLSIILSLHYMEAFIFLQAMHPMLSVPHWVEYPVLKTTGIAVAHLFVCLFVCQTCALPFFHIN